MISDNMYRRIMSTSEISISSRTSRTEWRSSRDSTRTSHSLGSTSRYFGFCTPGGHLLLFLRLRTRHFRANRRLTFCAFRVKVMLISIPFGFLRKCGPAIYSDINRYEDMLSSGKLSPKDEVSSHTHTPPGLSSSRF